MSKRYCIRVYESSQKDGSVGAGTVVEPVDSMISIYADSGDAAESKLQTEVEGGKYLRGRIYQICPSLSVPELIRSVAASLDGSFDRVFLDPFGGLYSDKRRVRLPVVPTFREEHARPALQVLGY